MLGSAEESIANLKKLHIESYESHRKIWLTLALSHPDFTLSQLNAITTILNRQGEVFWLACIIGRADFIDPKRNPTFFYFKFDTYLAQNNSAALQDAIWYDHPKIVEIIFNNTKKWKEIYASGQYKALNNAAEQGRLWFYEFIKRQGIALLELGRIESFFALHGAVLHNQFSVVEFILANTNSQIVPAMLISNGYTTYYNAGVNGNLIMFGLLISKLAVDKHCYAFKAVISGAANNNQMPMLLELDKLVDIRKLITEDDYKICKEVAFRGGVQSLAFLLKKLPPQCYYSIFDADTFKRIVTNNRATVLNILKKTMGIEWLQGKVAHYLYDAFYNTASNRGIEVLTFFFNELEEDFIAEMIKQRGLAIFELLRYRSNSEERDDHMDYESRTHLLSFPVFYELIRASGKFGDCIQAYDKLVAENKTKSTLPSVQETMQHRTFRSFEPKQNSPYVDEESKLGLD